MENYENMDILIERSKKKDTEAFTQLYKYVYKELYGFAMYNLQNPQDAEDVVSETVMAAFETIHKLRDPNAFKAWIFKILSNKCKAKMRQYYKRTLSLDDVEPSYETSYGDDQDVKKAFSELSSEERMIVSLTVFGGYRSHEISTILHLNANTVRSKYIRALKKMKDKL